MDFDEIYTDQAIRAPMKYGDRSLFSAWLPYGLRCIDGEHCARIMNLHAKVLSAEYEIRGPRNYVTDNLIVRWDNGGYHRFCYTRVEHIFDNKADDADKLEQEIVNNPHLHQVIKDNLLGNLKRMKREIKDMKKQKRCQKP